MDESDRPLGFLAPLGGDSHLRREAFSGFSDQDLNHESDSISSKIGGFVSQIHTGDLIPKVYNALLCPQCLMRIAVVRGVGVSFAEIQQSFTLNKFCAINNYIVSELFFCWKHF